MKPILRQNRNDRGIRILSQTAVMITALAFLGSGCGKADTAESERSVAALPYHDPSCGCGLKTLSKEFLPNFFRREEVSCERKVILSHFFSTEAIEVYSEQNDMLLKAWVRLRIEADHRFVIDYFETSEADEIVARNTSLILAEAATGITGDQKSSAGKFRRSGVWQFDDRNNIVLDDIGKVGIFGFEGDVKFAPNLEIFPKLPSTLKVLKTTEESTNDQVIQQQCQEDSGLAIPVK